MPLAAQLSYRCNGAAIPRDETGRGSCKLVCNLGESMEKGNPWRSIWFNPRSTIRNIVHENPNRSLWLLAFVLGLTSLFNGFQSFPIALRVGLIPMFAIALLLAALWGYLIFAVWSWAVLLTGKLFKGKATFMAARAAYAWSCVPLLGNVCLWLVLVSFFGSILFFGPQPNLVLSGSTVTLLFFLLIGKVVLSIWSIVIYLQALAEVQSYSVLRAIGNVILAAIFLGILFAIPLFLLALIGGGGAPNTAFLGGDLIHLIQ